MSPAKTTSAPRWAKTPQALPDEEQLHLISVRKQVSPLINADWKGQVFAFQLRQFWQLWPALEASLRRRRGDFGDVGKYFAFALQLLNYQITRLPNFL
jgi:hypothetical protein